MIITVKQYPGIPLCITIVGHEYPWGVIPIDYFWEGAKSDDRSSTFKRLEHGEEITFELKEVE